MRKLIGNAAVEFAIVMPIWLVVILGILELGWAMNVRQTMVDAVREGARLAITEGTTVTDVNNRVATILASNPTIDTSCVSAGTCLTITPDPVTATPGVDDITVTLTLPEADFFLVNTLFAPDTLTTMSIMRKDS